MTSRRTFRTAEFCADSRQHGYRTQPQPFRHAAPDQVIEHPRVRGTVVFDTFGGGAWTIGYILARRDECA